MTTNFQVLQIQQQLSDARVRELQALVGYNKAVAAYHRAVGDLLDVRNISVDEPNGRRNRRLLLRVRPLQLAELLSPTTLHQTEK